MPIENDFTRVYGAIKELEERVAALEGVTDDGWITWNGGECPVEDGVLVVFKTRNDSVHYNYTGKNLRWTNVGHYGDIIAYRVVK